MEKVAILMRKAPYGSVYTAEGFRSVMGIGVFEMDAALIFVDDGVYALVKDQNPEKLDMQPLGDGFDQFGVPVLSGKLQRFLADARGQLEFPRLRMGGGQSIQGVNVLPI